MLKWLALPELPLSLFCSGFISVWSVGVGYGKDCWTFSISRRQYSIMIKTVGAGHSSNPCFPLANHISLGTLPDCLGLSIPFGKIIIKIVHPHKTFFKVKWGFHCQALKRMPRVQWGLFIIVVFILSFLSSSSSSSSQVLSLCFLWLVPLVPNSIPVMFLYKGRAVTKQLLPLTSGPYSSRGLYQETIYCCSFKQFLFWEGQLDVEAKQGPGERIFSLLHPGDKVKYSSFRRRSRSSKRNNVYVCSFVIQNKSDRLTLNWLPSHTDSTILGVNSLSPTVRL